MIEAQRGRPRSESSRRAILEAVRDLITDVGYDAMTFEAIAAMAGTSRQTIYRWWKSKASVVSEAVVEGFVQLPRVTIPTTGSLRDDLKAWIASGPGVSATASADGARTIQIIRGLASAASADSNDAALLYEHLTRPTHQSLVARLDMGKSAGELPHRSDCVAVADALLGTVIFQILTPARPKERLLGVVDALVPAPE
ncbi:TetR/AcrR family transcriptional regulator [Arthrobacter sp. Sr24]